MSVNYYADRNSVSTITAAMLKFAINTANSGNATKTFVRFRVKICSIPTEITLIFTHYFLLHLFDNSSSPSYFLPAK